MDGNVDAYTTGIEIHNLHYTQFIIYEGVCASSQVYTVWRYTPTGNIILVLLSC